VVPVVRVLLQSNLSLRQRQPLGMVNGNEASKPTVSLINTLSKRERRVLELLATGCTMPQIGEKLFISPATVNNHCANMREKLGLRGRNALTTFATSDKNHLLFILIGFYYWLWYERGVNFVSQDGSKCRDLRTVVACSQLQSNFILIMRHKFFPHLCLLSLAFACFRKLQEG